MKIPVSCCPPALESSEERWSSVQSLNATPTPRYLRARRGRDVFSVRQSWSTEMTSRPKTSIRQKQMSEHQFGLVNTDGQMGISRLPGGRAAARASLYTALSRGCKGPQPSCTPLVVLPPSNWPHFVQCSARRAAGSVIYWTITVRASRRLPENRTPALRLWVRGDENTLDVGYRQRQPQLQGIHSKL